MRTRIVSQWCASLGVTRTRPSTIRALTIGQQGDQRQRKGGLHLVVHGKRAAMYVGMADAGHVGGTGTPPICGQL
jgi:hypothetical protein